MHVEVDGYTETTERPFESSSANRKSIHVLVAIQLGKKPVVIPLTGSKYNGCPPLRTYTTKKGKASTAMGANEYIDVLNRAFTMLSTTPSTGQNIAPRTRSSPYLVWHDHHRAHLSHDVTSWLTLHNITPVVLPPRSPDLDPLDYGVFGAAKRRHRDRRWGMQHMSFDDACTAFVEDLQRLDTDHVILSLLDRLQACVNAGGGHIEHELEALRRARRQG